MAHLDELPTLPMVAVKLLKLTSDETSTIEEVCELLRGDQSLSAKILSLANSAAVGRQVTTVEKAIVRLGFNTIRTTILTTKIFECFDLEDPANSQGFERVEFWRHAVAVGCAAKLIAARAPRLNIDPNEAFIAGLIHDIGKVALDAVFPKAYTRIAATAVETHGDIADCERNVLGVDHTIAGRRLAEKWNLPDTLRDVIWLHHLASETLPPSVKGGPLIGIVQTADTFVRENRIGFSGNHTFFENSTEVLARVNIPPTTLDDLSPTLIQEVSEWSSLLGLDTTTPESVYRKALSSANAELSRLYRELAHTNRQLAAGARYFQAISQFDQRLEPRSDLADVIRAIAESAVIACQRQRLGVFGLREEQSTLEVCWIPDNGVPVRNVTRNVSDELADWLEDPGDCLATVITRAPHAVRNLFASAMHVLGQGNAWLLPIVHANKVIGGIFFLSNTDVRTQYSPEADDLRSFLASLGLALGRANAQAAAQRLSDDLAENNRRLQRMQSEVLRSRTLATIAEMAAGAGHELNSPLAVISGRAQMLRKQTEGSVEQRTLELIVEKAHECSRIVKELMDFARPRPLKPANVPLDNLLRQLREHWLAKAETPATRFVLQSEDGLPIVYIDRDQVEVALTELIRNAAEATTKNNGTITLIGRKGVVPGLVEVVVGDTGYGMTQTIVQRAFDPFYSHRPAGRSRGLGLPRAERIIDAHGGRIWIESRPNEGTQVHVLLPMVQITPKVDVEHVDEAKPTAEPQQTPPTS